MTNITVTVIPASGEPQTIKVEASGATLAEVLKKAGIADQRLKATISGAAASLGDHVPDGATVTLTERAAGS